MEQPTGGEVECGDNALRGCWKETHEFGYFIAEEGSETVSSTVVGIVGLPVQRCCNC